MTRRMSHLGLTALALVAGQVVFAQDATTGAVFGTVKNNKGIAIASAKIILDGGRGQMEYATDVTGQFRITGLIPGKYMFTVVAAGYDKVLKQTINVGMNQRTPVNVVLTAAAAATVEVVATTGQIDATTVTTGAQFTSEQFSALPLGRSFLSVAALSPGVVGSGVDAANPSIGGGSGLENQYVIDGANTTNPGYGSSGSYSTSYGSMGSGINSDFISEVQVKGFALDAEYGQTTGGIVNAITKSGSNTFEGSAFAYFDIDSLQARNKVPNLSGTDYPLFDSSNRTEFGFTLSGPIIKDKLFFFVGYNPITQTVARIAPHNTTIDAENPEYPLAGRKFDQTVVTNAYYAKVQWQINTSQLLELSTFGDPGKRKFGPQMGPGSTGPDYRGELGKFSTLEFGSSTLTAKYNGVFFNDFLVESRISQNKTDFKRLPSAASKLEWSVADTARAGANISPNGIGLYENEQGGENNQYEIKINKTFGNLDLKVGYLYEDVTFNSEILRTGPFFHDPHTSAAYPAGVDLPYGLTIQKRYYLIDPALGDTPSNIAPFYRITRGNNSAPKISAKTNYSAYFIQGNYKMGNWNIKGGLRWEEQKLIGNVSTYTFKASDNLAPRLSITWDMDGDGKSKLYAFCGRFFEKVPLQIGIRALSQEQGINRSDFYTLTGFSGLSDPIANGVPITQIDAGMTYDPTDPTARIIAAQTTHFRTVGDETTMILPGTKSMYQDELMFGYDHELVSGITISNRIVMKNVGRIMEDLSLDGNSYFIGNPGGNEHEIRNLTGFTGEATFPAPVRKYFAYEMDVRKNLGKITGFMNFRISKIEGNYEGLFRGDNGQDDPNISSLYDLPVEQLVDDSRGLTGREQFLIGALPTDRTVVVNFGLNYTFDFGLNLGGVGRLSTGTPITTYLAHPVYENAGEIPQYGRGSEGRTPTTYTFDLSASYMMKVFGKHRITLRADIFNILNQQKITGYDTNFDTGIGNTNVNWMRANTFDTGRQVRLGVKYSF